MDISKMGALFPKPVASPAQSLGQVSKYNSKNCFLQICKIA